MGEVVLTFETIFELLRLERSRTELQELPHDYFEGVQVLLRGLESAGSELKQSSSLRKIVSELYDRRERKIVLLALDKSKTQGALIDFKRFLPQEKRLFDEILNLLLSYRETSGEKIPEKTQARIEHPVIATTKKQTSIGTSQTESTVSETNPISASPVSPLNPTTGDMRMIRLLSPFPSFLGPELETYGPFGEDDVTSVPGSVAKLLVEKKRAAFLL